LFALGEGGMTPLWVLLTYLALQVFENNVIHPFLMVRGMKLHPVAVIFSMLLCVAAFGVLGVRVAARPGCHCGYLARRALSKALSSHGNGRGFRSSGTIRPERKAVYWQVTRVLWYEI